MKVKALKPAIVVAQQDGTLGIDNVKNILTIVVTFFVDVVDVIKTKNYIQLLQIVWNLVRFGNIIDVAKLAWEELQEMSLEETKAVTDHIKAVLELPDEETEDKIEQAVDIIPRVYELALKVLGIGGEALQVWNEVKAIFSSNGELAAA